MIDTQTARTCAFLACQRAGVLLVSPDSPSMLRGAVRAAVAAVAPLSVEEVGARVSIYVPKIIGEIVALLPSPVLAAYPVDRIPCIYLSEGIWNDPVGLVGAVAHELGHAAQDNVASRHGIFGEVAHGVAYLLCGVARADAEATCYVADMTARYVLRGDDLAEYQAGMLEALATAYRLDDHACDHARSTLDSAAASLACGVLHGRGTPIEGMLRELRDIGIPIDRITLPPIGS